jgi:hypothetical protein
MVRARCDEQVVLLMLGMVREAIGWSDHARKSLFYILLIYGQHSS